MFKRRLRKRRALAGLTRLLIVLSAAQSPSRRVGLRAGYLRLG